MRHTHTPAENFMLANIYLDVIEGLTTLEEANEYLRSHYEHHPSSRSVSSYLGAARTCYEDIRADADRKGNGSRKGNRSPKGDGRRRSTSARRRYSSDLDFEMRLAVDQRGGD